MTTDRDGEQKLPKSTEGLHIESDSDKQRSGGLIVTGEVSSVDSARSLSGLIVVFLSGRGFSLMIENQIVATSKRKNQLVPTLAIASTIRVCRVNVLGIFRL